MSLFTVCVSKRHKLVDIGIGHEDGKTWEKGNMKKTVHSTGCCISQHPPSLVHMSSTCCLLLCGKGTAQGVNHSMQPAVWFFRSPRHNDSFMVVQACSDHFFGCGFAMAWAQNLLGFCLFACASQTPFSWVWPGGLQVFSLFLVGSKSNVSAVFWLRFRMVWALFLSLFNGFQQRRFGIFPATVSQWLGHKTCWGSAFSHARPKHLFLEFWPGGLQASKSYVAQRFALLEATFFLCF